MGFDGPYHFLTLAQLAEMNQIRIWITDMKCEEVDVPDFMLCANQDESMLLLIPNLEQDLMAKLVKTNDFLQSIRVFEDKKAEIEVDYESRDDMTEFTILLTTYGRMILLHTSSSNKLHFAERLQVEWIKLITQ